MMNQHDQNDAAINIDGQKYLYTQPEPLTLQDHGHLGINPSSRPYKFTKSVAMVPIVAAELTAAQRNYPIVFSDLKQPGLMAFVAVADEDNLFVDEDGEWDRSAYIPAYLRCHPFALAARPDDQHVVIIDRAASVISENAEQPFFDGKELAPAIQARVDLCLQYDAHRKASKTFCDKLVELKLLSGQEARFKTDDGGEGRSMGNYVAVDFEKLKELDAETLQQLHVDGTLSAIYAHCFSLDNWLRLLERRKMRQSAA